MQVTGYATKIARDLPTTRWLRVTRALNIVNSHTPVMLEMNHLTRLVRLRVCPVSIERQKSRIVPILFAISHARRRA